MDAYHINLTGNDISKVDDENIIISARSIAQNMTPENFAQVIDFYVNNYGNTTQRGVAVGHALRNSHRTLQRSAIELLLGILCGISEQEWTDPRNQTAIATAKTIKGMVDNGDLPLGMFV
jgi:hypothetical protein